MDNTTFSFVVMSKRKEAATYANSEKFKRVLFMEEHGELVGVS